MHESLLGTNSMAGMRPAQGGESQTDQGSMVSFLEQMLLHEETKGSG
jgi:hypothetical protein